jgi:hypothetical protein
MQHLLAQRLCSPCTAVQDAPPVLRQGTTGAGDCVGRVHLHAAQLLVDGVGRQAAQQGGEGREVARIGTRLQPVAHTSL